MRRQFALGYSQIQNDSRTVSFTIRVLYRLLLANVCNKWKFWSCTWQLCISWTALDYVTHDDGPQSLKSNFYHKIASKLKNWFIIVNCVIFNLRFALNILKTNYLQYKRFDDHSWNFVSHCKHFAKIRSVHLVLEIPFFQTLPMMNDHRWGSEQRLM